MPNHIFEHVISRLTETVSNVRRKNITITQEDYEVWQPHSTFDMINGLRYGQSFCNHFAITDNILYYESSWAEADKYIRKQYLKH